MLHNILDISRDNYCWFIIVLQKCAQRSMQYHYDVNMKVAILFPNELNISNAGQFWSISKKLVLYVCMYIFSNHAMSYNWRRLCCFMLLRLTRYRHTSYCFSIISRNIWINQSGYLMMKFCETKLSQLCYPTEALKGHQTYGNWSSIVLSSFTHA